MAVAMRDIMPSGKRYPTKGAYTKKELNQALDGLYDAQLMPIDIMQRICAQIADIPGDTVTKDHIKRFAPAVKVLAQRLKQMQPEINREVPFIAESVNAFLGHYGNQLVGFRYLTPTQKANRTAIRRGAYFQV